MNTGLRSACCALALIALGGCASSGGVASYPAARADPASVEHQVVDAEYVAAVERYARRSGALVQWVNLPRKRVVASAGP